jgi:hypothetical protein
MRITFKGILLEKSDEELLNEPNPPKTKYQQNHKFISREEIKCDGIPNKDGDCEKCGRIGLKSKKKHNPNIYGYFGYIETYGDGSKRFAIDEDFLRKQNR